MEIPLEAPRPPAAAAAAAATAVDACVGAVFTCFDECKTHTFKAPLWLSTEARVRSGLPAATTAATCRRCLAAGAASRARLNAPLLHELHGARAPPHIVHPLTTPLTPFQPAAAQAFWFLQWRHVRSADGCGPNRIYQV